jgi:hypothetical protein
MLIGLIGVMAVLGTAAPAQGQSSPTAADDQYGAVLGEQAGGGQAGGGAGGLPFTGLDLLLVGGAGAALGCCGLLMHRIARAADPG